MLKWFFSVFMYSGLVWLGSAAVFTLVHIGITGSFTENDATRYTFLGFMVGVLFFRERDSAWEEQFKNRSNTP